MNYKIGDRIIDKDAFCSFHKGIIVAEHYAGGWIIQITEASQPHKMIHTVGSLLLRSSDVLDDFYAKDEKVEFFKVGETYVYDIATRNTKYQVVEVFHVDNPQYYNATDYAVAFAEDVNIVGRYMDLLDRGAFKRMTQL